jgi:hypothetical protein
MGKLKMAVMLLWIVVICGCTTTRFVGVFGTRDLLLVSKKIGLERRYFVASGDRDHFERITFGSEGFSEAELLQYFRNLPTKSTILWRAIPGTPYEYPPHSIDNKISTELTKLGFPIQHLMTVIE